MNEKEEINQDDLEAMEEVKEEVRQEVIDLMEEMEEKLNEQVDQIEKSGVVQSNELRFVQEFRKTIASLTDDISDQELDQLVHGFTYKLSNNLNGAEIHFLAQRWGAFVSRIWKVLGEKTESPELHRQYFLRQNGKNFNFEI